MTALSIKPKELSREPIQESDSPTMSLPQDGTEPLAGRRHESGGTIPEVVSPWPQKRFYGHSKWISYARRRGLASTPMVAGGYYIDPEFSPTLATTAEEPQQVLSLEPAPMVATVHAIPTAPTIQESYRIVQCWKEQSRIWTRRVSLRSCATKPTGNTHWSKRSFLVMKWMRTT